MADNTDETTPPPSATAPAPNPKTSREAIALAVQARLSGGGSSSNPADAEQYRRKTEETEFMHQLGRVVHLQIKRDNKYETAAECLKTLSTIVNNILQNPTEKKYRSFRAANGRIQRCILDVPGGRDFLVKSGFRVRTVEFKEEWFLPDEARPAASAGYNKLWRHLELAASMLREVTLVAEERASAKREREEREEQAEKQRVAVALAEARADREVVAQRAARERRVREHREQREREEAARSSARASAREGGGHGVGEGQGSGSEGEQD